MKRMSFSRFIYFESLINQILAFTQKQLKEKADPIKEKIKFEVDLIYRKQRGGYWTITIGDSVFIEYMNRLSVLLNERSPQKEIVKLLNQAKHEAYDKLKVTIFLNDTYVWPSFKSLYEAYSKDLNSLVSLVYVPFSHVNMENNTNHFIHYQELGLPVIKHDQYHLSQDSPDVVFYAKPYDLIPSQFYIENVDKIVRRCVYIPYALIDESMDYWILYGYCLPMHYKAWRIIAYSKQYMDNIKKYGFRKGENAVILGHPKFDISTGLNGYDEDETTRLYRTKIKGRRTLVWNTHHSIEERQDSVGSFLEYKTKVINYFRQNKDVFLLWRPHPLLFGALQSQKIMTEPEIVKLKKQLEEEDNIIIDESNDYINSFNLSHGMLSDGGSSMPFEYVATGKPVYYAVKQNGYIMAKDSIAECWYWINTPDKIDHYLDSFAQGEDPMKLERLEKSKKHIALVDGHCGERIKDYIFQEIVKEEKQRANIL